MTVIKNTLILFKHLILLKWYDLDISIPNSISTTKKIFIIGFNKTGTTSLKSFFEENGYKIGDQVVGELLLTDVIKKKYDRLLSYCDTAEVFQDIPFSTPNIYRLLHENYPNAKFILSVRDSSEQWYNSLYQFHNKIFNYNDKITLIKVLYVPYVFVGFAFLSLMHVFGTWNYSKKIYIKAYLKHNKEVEQYFEDYPRSFVKINVSNKQDFDRLVDRLNLDTEMTHFPWKNKTN